MRELLMTIAASSLVLVLAIETAQLIFDCWTGGISEEEAEDEPRCYKKAPDTEETCQAQNRGIKDDTIIIPNKFNFVKGVYLNEKL